MLTIAIPTYNRSRYLSFLLSTLENELQSLQGQVQVMVFDNASSDDTPAVVAQFASRMPNFWHSRNDVNEGADSNIEACYLLPQTPYVWVLGDDDAPLAGALPLLIELLRRESPDLVYLPSLSTTNIQQDHAVHHIEQLAAVELSSHDFADVINVQMTFISGLVTRKSIALDQLVKKQLCVTQGTSLVQLAWVLESLKRGGKFLVCLDNLLMATAANGGGYAVLQVFLVNHTRIVGALLAGQPAMSRRIMSNTSLCFLPGLMWHVRKGSIGDFQLQGRSELDLPDELTRTTGFRWLVKPIWSLPINLARIVFFVSRIVTFTMRRYQRIFLFPRRRSLKVMP